MGGSERGGEWTHTRERSARWEPKARARPRDRGHDAAGGRNEQRKRFIRYEEVIATLQWGGRQGSTRFQHQTCSADSKTADAADAAEQQSRTAARGFGRITPAREEVHMQRSGW